MIKKILFLCNMYFLSIYSMNSKDNDLELGMHNLIKSVQIASEKIHQEDPYQITHHHLGFMIYTMREQTNNKPDALTTMKNSLKPLLENPNLNTLCRTYIGGELQLVFIPTKLIDDKYTDALYSFGYSRKSSINNEPKKIVSKIIEVSTKENTDLYKIELDTFRNEDRFESWLSASRDLLQNEYRNRVENLKGKKLN